MRPPHVPARSLVVAPLLAAWLAAPGAAQTDYSATISPQFSTFTWSGTTSLGPLVGNPSNEFYLANSVDARFTGGSQGFVSGELLGSDAYVTPNVSGRIRSGFPGVNLATATIQTLRLSATAPAFVVAPDGTFTADVTLTVLQGTLVVDSILGSGSSDLTGTTGQPTPSNGTIVPNTFNDLILTMPVASQFDFVDPNSGVTGTLSVTGTLFASVQGDLPASYCQTAPNSVGPGALMDWSGSSFVEHNDLTLIATGCPTTTLGIFYYGTAELQSAFGNGFRCVGGQFARLPAVQTVGGVASSRPDLRMLPPTLPIAPGDVRKFQFWYRNPAGGGLGFNLSDGLSVVFHP